MADKQKTNDHESMMEFFKDDSAAIVDPSLNLKDEDRIMEPTFKVPKPKLTLEKVVPADDQEMADYWRELRLFFQTTQGGGQINKDNQPALKPIHFSGLLNQHLEADNYPFWIDENDPNESATLKSLMEDGLAETAKFVLQQGLLRQRIEGLLSAVSTQLEGEYSAFSFVPVIDRAAAALVEELGLKDTDKQQFEKDFSILKKNLPDHGVLIRKSENTYYQLLSAAMSISGEVNKTNLIVEIEGIISQLNELLAIQEENDANAKDPEHLKSTFDDPEGMLDFDKLSAMLPDGGGELMSKERVERIKHTLSVLQNAEKILSDSTRVFIQEELAEGKEEFLKEMFLPAKVNHVSGKNAGKTVLSAFQKGMSQFAGLIAAKRIGELDANGAYDVETHDPFFDRFNWRLITEEEIHSFPAIVLVLNSRTIAKEQMNGLSYILSKNIPIKILAFRTIDQEKSSADLSIEEAFETFELGSMAVSYRNSFVLQGSILSPDFIYQGFVEGLMAPSTAVFYVLQENPNDPIVWSSAAIEGRAFPGFIFNGRRGTEWGSRFNMSNNPQPELNWPKHTFDLTDKNEVLEKLEVDFTYADYKALNPKYEADFKLVPPIYWTSDLIPLADYLVLTEKEQYSKIPFIWMVNADNQLQKVAVSWELMVMVYEKLDYWHFIQENGGVNSFHVHQALEKEKEQLKAEADLQIEVLKKSHEEALEEVKNETTGAAMERLTSMLLDLDPSAIIPSSSTSSTVEQPSIQEEEETITEPEQQAEADDVLSMDEPWLETPLCTSCNECTELNGVMFKYNGDKMAYIADPKAGTYAQLVEAAEKCPVHIIHPGQPLNPDEPDLEALIKRAKKFN